MSEAPAARIEVAVYAAHQVAQEQVEQSLAPAEFNVHACPIGEPASLSAEAIRSQVQIVDVAGSLRLVEAVAAHLRQHMVVPRLLALDESFSADSTFPLLFLGVRGLVSYDRLPHELARAARQVAQGVYWMPRQMLSGMVEMLLERVPAAQKPFPLIQISRRERELMPLLAESRTNKEIAAQMHISERTVKYHVANLLKKCRVRKRHELAIFLFRHRLLPGMTPEEAPDPYREVS